MALAFTTTLVMVPPVDVAVTLKIAGVPTGTGFGVADAALMLIAVASGVKTATAKLFFWVPVAHAAAKVSVPPLNPAI